jgi:hypothetical protein
MANKPSHKHQTRPGHAHQNTAGANASKKTRADVPSTPANKAASGKQVDPPR